VSFDCSVVPLPLLFVVVGGSVHLHYVVLPLFCVAVVVVVRLRCGAVPFGEFTALYGLFCGCLPLLLPRLLRLRCCWVPLPFCWALFRCCLFVTLIPPVTHVDCCWYLLLVVVPVARCYLITLRLLHVCVVPLF